MIKGRIVAVGWQGSGTRKTDGKPWRSQEYVLETEGQYPTKVAFKLLNEKIDEAAIQMGHTVQIEVNASSREYNGKWYTELTAWKVRNLSIMNPAAQQPGTTQPAYEQTAPQGYTAPAPQTVAQSASADDDMPF